MKRITIVLAGAAVLFAGAANAQQNIDFSKVEIKATDLGNKTYMLAGQGGNITVADRASAVLPGQGSSYTTWGSPPRAIPAPTPAVAAAWPRELPGLPGTGVAVLAPAVPWAPWWRPS